MPDIILPASALKTCNKCLVQLNISSFSKKSASKDGHCSICKTCCNAYAFDYFVKNREDIEAKSAAIRKANPDLRRKTQAKYKLSNRESARAYNAKWRADNSEYIAKNRHISAAKDRERVRMWAVENPDKDRAKVALKRAQKIQATSIWSDRIEVLAVYAEAQRLMMVTGMEFHVDHIVPLKSKFVCGLHVPANLQILTATENIKKGNRHWPDMP